MTIHHPADIKFGSFVLAPIPGGVYNFVQVFFCLEYWWYKYGKDINQISIFLPEKIISPEILTQWFPIISQDVSNILFTIKDNENTNEKTTVQNLIYNKINENLIGFLYK